MADDKKPLILHKENTAKKPKKNEYLAKWGPKGFLTNPKKAVPFWDLKTSFAMKDSHTTEDGRILAKKEAQRISFKTRYAFAVGTDPKAQMAEWYKQIGEKHAMYIGGVQFGPPLLMLEDVKYSNFKFAPNGTIIAMDVEIFLVEWYKGIELSQGWFNPKKEEAMVTGDIFAEGISNQEKIWNFLRSQGFSAAATAGVIGNYEAECGCNPDSEEIPNGYGTHGYGLAQWTNTGYNPATGTYSSPRRTKLFNWCSQHGKNVKLLETQLEYMMVEYNETFAAYIKAQSGYDYKTITSVYTATDVWLDWFEGIRSRIEIVHWDRRLAAANKFYNMWKNYKIVPHARPIGGGSIGSDVCPPQFKYIMDHTGWPGPDRCATWASAVYQQAIGIHPNLHGSGYATSYGRSTNLSTLKPGMMMACEHSPWSYRYGHVGIYAGGGIVYSSERSGIEHRPVKQFIEMYGPRNGGSTVLWGWVENRPILK